MVEPQINAIEKSRKQTLWIVIATVSSMLLCLMLIVAYSTVVGSGWRKVELHASMEVNIPKNWSYTVDADKMGSTIFDEDGSVLFTGFVHESLTEYFALVQVDRRLVGYVFVGETQYLTDEMCMWHERQYRDIATGGLVTVQVINYRGSVGMFCLYSTPDAVDRNTARKMAFSYGSFYERRAK